MEMGLLSRLYRRITAKESLVSYGNDYADKKFYVIRVDYNMAGILAIVKSTMSHIMYAVEHKYIPVIDLLNCECQYIDHDYPENVWDTYFKQPYGYNLKDISCAKNVIISKNIQVPKRKYNISVNTLYGNKTLLNYYRQFYQKYIHFNIETQKYVESKYNQIIPSNNKILGVLSRGTDYLDCHPKGHPIQPDPKEIIAKIYEITQKKDYQYIFLATEDQRIYDLFKNEFKERLLFNKQKLLQKMNGINYISELDKTHGLSQKEDVLNYLTSLYILSRCNAFIGGCTAGTLGAYMMSNMYEYEYFWNLGTY